MIKAEITQYGQQTRVGDPLEKHEIFDNSINTISVQNNLLIVNSEKWGVDGADEIINPEKNEFICTIFFKLSPELLKELKLLVAVIEAELTPD